MIQPKYSPKEALKQMKLLMKYDTSKTLNENKKVIKESQDKAQRALLAKCDSNNDTLLDKSVLFMSNEKHIDNAGLFNSAFASAFGTNNDKWRQALKDMGDNGGFGDLCAIREKYKDQAGETLEDGIDADIDFDTEYAEFITAFQKMMERTKNIGLKTKDATSQNIDAWETKFPCVFMSNSNVDKKVPKDDNNYPYILIRGKSGTQFKLFFDGRVKTMDDKQTGKRLSCSGDVVIVENVKKKTLLEQFDDSNLIGGGNNPTPKPEDDCKTNPNQEKCKKKQPFVWNENCKIYKIGCKSDVIAKVQGCVGGLTPDGKFGKKTSAKLKELNYDTFTDADVDKICKTQPIEDTDSVEIEDKDPNKI